MEVIMNTVFRRSLIFVAALALLTVACDDDDTVMSPAAPREPVATATPTPAASASPTPSAPSDGQSVGFLGAIREIRNFRMTIGDVEEVAWNGETEFRRNGQAAAASDFSVGERVRVQGVVLGDGAILAKRISLLTD
jgi:hypothetical protein